MSDQTIELNNGQQAIIHTDLSRIFVGRNRYDKGEVNNSDIYDPLVLPIGTLMGRVAATGLLAPFDAGGSDGTQYVVGVLATDYTIDEGDTKEVYVCVEGDVVESKIVFQGSDDMDTIVSGRIVRDKIGSESVGIKLIASTELSNYDND
jgi:hypothetical protein